MVDLMNRGLQFPGFTKKKKPVLFTSAYYSYIYLFERNSTTETQFKKLTLIFRNDVGRYQGRHRASRRRLEEPSPVHLVILDHLNL